MRQLVYVSRATRPLEFHEEAEILATARACNEESGITGVLLAKDQLFIQLLEGDHEAVEETFRRIRRDRRHIDVTVLCDGETNMPRLFADWRMGFVHLSAAEYAAGEGLVPNDDKGFAAAVSTAAPRSPAAVILHEFWKANRRVLSPLTASLATN
jgi:hypothetical protein